MAKREYFWERSGSVSLIVLMAASVMALASGAASAQEASAPDALTVSSTAGAIVGKSAAVPADSEHVALVCPIEPSKGSAQSACPASVLVASKKPVASASNPVKLATAKPVTVGKAPVALASAAAAATPKPFVPRPLHARTPPPPPGTLLAKATPKPVRKGPTVMLADATGAAFGSVDTVMPPNEAVTEGAVVAENAPINDPVLLAEAVAHAANEAVRQVRSGVSTTTPAPSTVRLAAALSQGATVQLAEQSQSNPLLLSQNAPSVDTPAVAAPSVQARGLASGQDVAALGLKDEKAFSVAGLGGGQNLSALDVGMPVMIRQILANDEVRGAVTAPATTPPEETTAEFQERVTLARQLMSVDGSEDLVRHLVNTVHMRLVVGEVNKYLNINSLPENERYRLSAIVATAAAELSERILNLNARTQARVMTKPELSQLIVDLDIDAQKKLTRLRLEDDGTLDKQAELEIQLAQLQIIKAFEHR